MAGINPERNRGTNGHCAVDRERVILEFRRSTTLGLGERPLTVNQDSLSELSQSVSQTAGTLFAAGNVTDTLTSVVELAVATIEGCDFAGLFAVKDGALTTPVFTDPTVLAVDSVQQRTGEGPCLDAIARRLIVAVDDLTTDLRWPDFSPLAVSEGIRSVLSLPLASNSQGAALNLYARYPAAFGVVDRAKATILVSLASLAESVAHSHEDEERRAENLNAALGTRETIGEALGILMERERITADEAFDILRRASQHLNIKLRDVAQNLVDTGESPDTGKPGCS
jgi:GAF domain-containing protein